MPRDDAQVTAVQALAFIAQDPDLLHRFIGVTGIEADAMREAAREPGFLAGVLEFICAHEPTLSAFCAQTGIAGETVAAANRALGATGGELSSGEF